MSSIPLNEFVTGSAAPWLYIHGGPGGSAVQFERKFFNGSYSIGFITYDQRGGGRSTYTGPLSHDRNVEDLADVSNQISERFGVLKIVAHSYGASLVAAAISSKMIVPQALVFVSPVYDFHAASYSLFLHALTYAKAEDWAGAASAVTEQDDQDFFIQRDALVDHILGSRHFKSLYWFDQNTFCTYLDAHSGVDLNQRAYKELRPTLFSGFHGYFPSSPKMCKDLLVNAAPDLILFGHFDVMCLPHQVAIWKERDHTVRYFDGGHFPHFECPEEFCAMLSHLEETTVKGHLGSKK